MRRLIVFALTAGAVSGQPAVVSEKGPGPLVLAPGVALRVALERRVVVRKVGDPVQGRLIEPVYVFDRIALPSGTVFEGRVARIGGVPLGRRTAAILSGNLTPARDLYAQFDSIVLADGSRMALAASPSTGTAYTAVVDMQKDRRRPGRGIGDSASGAMNCPAGKPGKVREFKSRLFDMFPYHRQSWSAGTLFTAVIEKPLAVPAPVHSDSESSCRSIPADGGGQVRARLLTGVSSSTARRGDRVEAVVTRPLFSADHVLLVPEGSRLIGEVVSARGARFFHRNGRLRFSFRQVTLVSGAMQPVQGTLEQLEADSSAQLALDSEGGTRVTSPKTRFIFPVVAAAVAGLSVHQDYNAQGIPDQDIGGRAESGAVGLGLIGTVLAQVSRPVASAIAFTGAGFSVYSTFIARGSQVVLPAGTPMEISLKSERQTTPQILPR